MFTNYHEVLPVNITGLAAVRLSISGGASQEVRYANITTQIYCRSKLAMSRNAYNKNL